MSRFKAIMNNDLADKVQQAKDDLALKTARLKEEEVVVSPVDGRVTGIGTLQGERVNTGDELVTLERLEDKDDRTLQVLQYYPASTAKQISRGMVTQVAPGTVKVDQYGYLLATVSQVASFPSTTKELEARLQNDELVKEIEALGPVLEIESRLIKDTSTPSGYQWTSSKGPPYSLEVGTPCTASVIVEEVPPISLVIPMIKEVVLGIGEKRP